MILGSLQSLRILSIWFSLYVGLSIALQMSG